VGIDIIGDYMTEINVTSPTGIREIQRLSGIDIAAKTWDAIESKKIIAIEQINSKRS
jgi:glutathione synthase